MKNLTNPQYDGGLHIFNPGTQSCIDCYVRNITFSDSNALEFGSGITFFQVKNITISNIVMENNYPKEGVLKPSGGGLFLRNADDISIFDIKVQNNTAYQYEMVQCYEYCNNILLDTGFGYNNGLGINIINFLIKFI